MKYPLTDRQKDMIRFLAPELRDGTVESDWIIITGDNRIMSIFGLDDEQLWTDPKNGVKFSDFDAFIRCGFFQRTGKNNFTLNEALILDAIDHNFADDEPPMKTEVNISGGDFRGAIVNAASTLTNVQQSVGSVPQLGGDAKAQLTQLIAQLKEELSKVPEEEAEEAEVLAHHVQVAVDQLNAPKPNKKLLSVSVDGLEKAATNIERVALPVAAVAVKIALLLRPLTM